MSCKNYLFNEEGDNNNDVIRNANILIKNLCFALPEEFFERFYLLIYKAVDAKTKEQKIQLLKDFEDFFNTYYIFSDEFIKKSKQLFIKILERELKYEKDNN